MLAVSFLWILINMWFHKNKGLLLEQEWKIMSDSEAFLLLVDWLLEFGVSKCLEKITSNSRFIRLLSLSCCHVWLFSAPWTAACQDSLSFTIFQILLELMSIESVMPSDHLILCRPLLLPSIFPSIRVFSNESVVHIRGQSTGGSASASVLPMNIRGWFPLELTGLISLLSMGLPRVFSSTTIWKHQFFCTQPSLWSNFHIHTWLLEKP